MRREEKHYKRLKRRLAEIKKWKKRVLKIRTLENYESQSNGERFSGLRDWTKDKEDYLYLRHTSGACSCSACKSGKYDRKKIKKQTNQLLDEYQ